MLGGDFPVPPVATEQPALPQSTTHPLDAPPHQLRRPGLARLSGVIRLIVYVDDLAFAGNDPELIASFKKQLSDEKTGFSMKDLGTLRYFLGMHVEQDLVAGTLKLHQRQYIEDMIKRYSQFTKDLKPKPTPSDPDVVLSKADCPHPEDDHGTRGAPRCGPRGTVPALHVPLTPRTLRAIPSRFP